MENFKKGLMTTLGVMAGLSLYVAIGSLFKKSVAKSEEKEAEKTE